MKWQRTDVPRPDLAHLQCPLTPDPECIAIGDFMCCHSSSPTECAFEPERMCTAHESLHGDWAMGFGAPARRDNDFAPPIVCEHAAHEPYRVEMYEWLQAIKEHGWPNVERQDMDNDALRRLWAHHYNDVCPAWPYERGN